MAILKKIDSVIASAKNNADHSRYADAKRFRNQASQFDKYRFRAICSFIKGSGNADSAIEIGCDIAELAVEYEKRFSRIIFFDKNIFSLRSAQTACKTRLLKPCFVCGDAADLPFKDGCFGSVFCFEVLEHLPQNRHGAAVNELLRISKKGADVWMSTPNRISVAGLEGMLMELFVRGFKWNAWDPSHRYIYSSFEFIRFIKTFGCDIRRVFAFYFLPGSLLVRMPFFAQRFLGFYSYLLSKVIGDKAPLKYFGFTTFIKFKKADNA